MSVSAVYTTVIVQLHVQTLLDPLTVHVIILFLEMEKRAASFQVNVWHFKQVIQVPSSSQFYSFL